MASNSYSVYTAFKAKDGVSPVFKNMSQSSNAFQGRLNKLNYSARNVGNSVQGTFQKINGLINAAIAFFAVNALNATLKSFVDKASDLQETVSKTTQVFKANSMEVLNWSKTGIKTMGLSEQTSLDTASLYGDMATGMGLTTKKASVMSMGLTQLTADLASFKNINQDIAKTALAGVFTGETESLKQLGIIMTEANLQEYARSKGIRKKIQDMKQAEKVELRYQYVLNQTKNAQGDFIRTGGGFANQQRINQEKLKQMFTNFGKFMLPTYTKMFVMFNSRLDKYSPQIEATFGKTFNSVIQIAKSVKPVFDKLIEAFSYLGEYLSPIIASLRPQLKMLLTQVLVPGLVLAIDALEKCFFAMNEVFKVTKSVFDFIKNNWLPILLALPIAFVGVQFAIDTLRLKMALMRMEGGLMAMVMNTQLMTSLSAFTASVWKSVTALFAQAAAFAMSPVGLIVMGIMALVGVTILLWKNWDRVTATISNWWNSTQALLTSFWTKCQEVFSAVGSFIKNNFINILLGALGPVGLIIQGLLRIPSIIKSLKGGGGIQINGANGQNVQNKTVHQNPTAKNGRIDVGLKLENNTGFPASSSLGLEGSHGLTLNPA